MNLEKMKKMQILLAATTPEDNFQIKDFIDASYFKNKDKMSPDELADMVNSIIKLTFIDPCKKNAKEFHEKLHFGDMELKEDNLYLTENAHIYYMNEWIKDLNKEDKD